MRNYRNAVATLMLALVLSTPAFAGIMVSEKASPTPTPAATGIIVSEATEGETETVEPEPSTEAAVLTEIALDLLRSALSLF
jgi:hypothetical protein